jgi:hypothetical protein
MLVIGVGERNPRLENGKPRLPLGRIQFRLAFRVPTPCPALAFPRHRPQEGLTCSAAAFCG